MTVTVWADVGGTFTDCIVIDGSTRHHTKVLSSGVIRAKLEAWTTSHSFRATELAGHDIPGFWKNARVSILDTHGNQQRTGKVTRHEKGLLTFAEKAPGESNQTTPSNISGAALNDETVAAKNQETVIELNANLEAPVLATRLLLGIPLDTPLPALDVRLGTTRGTNALLTRRGASTAVLVTKGFADILRIGEQDRPQLFSLSIEKNLPLTDRVLEIDERLDASGSVIQSPDIDSVTAMLSRLKSDGIDSLAICLLHSHINDEHERRIEQLAKESGFQNISRSSEVAPLIKYVSRTETTVLDAYLNPILSGYVANVWQQLGGSSQCRLRLMTSNGKLVSPAAFRGRDSILSGPAGGVVALGHVAECAAAGNAIGLDMGGTSTDVSRYEGQVGRRHESRVAGVRVMTAMMDIETVAAGGGSICHYNAEQRLAVGPESAGANPGPACYGRGGPLTVTDVNLLLGRVPEYRFPFPLNRQAATQALQSVLHQIPQNSGLTSVEQLAEGFFSIAVTHMAEAVRTVSTAQGSDVRNMVLVGFGGAAGQHLCRVASVLGMKRILDHPDSGMLSALGMGLADQGQVVTRGVYELLKDLTTESIHATAKKLTHDAKDQLKDELETGQQLTYVLEADVRYEGTEASLSIPLFPTETLLERFHQKHKKIFGYIQAERAVELAALRCDATLQADKKSFPEHQKTIVGAANTRQMWHEDQWVDTQQIDRDVLSPATIISGPAMIVGNHSTLVVEPGWQARKIQDGILEVTCGDADMKQCDLDLKTEQQKLTSDPVLLEVIARRLQGIADAMGEVLRRTSISVNVKERRDYSCAVFRHDGSLIANAPHVPVHLGAMGHTVRQVMQRFPEMSPHDCYLSNDPYAGGSHLPDVTAITPVFCDADTTKGSPDFYVASRAHHAEIGGRTPGSMPPNATSLVEEGVVIRNFALVKSGHNHEGDLKQLLSTGRYPSRCVSENLADIAAQQAAGAHGVRALTGLAQQYSVETVDTFMGQILDLAGDSMQRWIQTLPDDPISFEDHLDDGSRIAATLQRDKNHLDICFDTSPVHPHGFNATPAIVTAATLYVLRCVSGSNLPLCDGVLRDVTVQIPEGMLDPPYHADPAQCAAVVAGNVETSQRIVDVLLGALGVAAASQGTMNNVLIGDRTFGYYETIGGGSGATASRPGADAVHTHMTNTRITDPEILESRLPVRLRRFAIRRESGGSGLHRGGDGMIREFEFMKPLVISLLTGRRNIGPYGASGGMAGKVGRNLLVHEGKTELLGATASLSVVAGDRLIIKTPGGGGWGNAPG
ncbi:MAG: 5-oxoprolinase [Rhodopirellula sp.]|nr:5-oxoprolinase [Rhodopirellula sp.]